MAISIEQLNQKQAEKALRMKSTAADPYAGYRSQLKNKAKFEMTFPLSDSTGNLYAIDANKIKIILPMNALQETDRYYTKELRGTYVGIKTLEVMIERIDEEEGVVYLKSGRTTENIVRAITNTLFDEVHARYEARKRGEQLNPYPVYGTVVKVDAERQNATVRLFNQNIYATIHVSKWSKSFLRSIPEGVEDTDCPMQFDLIGTAQINGKRYFRLSGENYNEDAWDEIPENIFEEKAVIVVTCIEKPTDKRHWWGKCEGINIELIGNYTDKFKVEVGRDYLCTVKRTKSDSRTLIVTPFKYLRKEGETKESLAYLSRQDVEDLYNEKKKASKNADKPTE